MSTLYLHIGTPKTGTTAVQHFMFCNRKILSELGCFVPDFGLRYKGIGYRRNAHWLLPFVREEKQYRKCMRVLEENAKKYPAIFMSDEAIWNTCGSRPGYWKKLMEELAEIGIRLKVIAYVRRQDDYLYSYWAEQVRRGNTGAVNYREYKAESPRVFEHLNYYRYFKTIIPVIGQENISIGIYESGRFQNLQDISRDMLSRIDEVQWSEKFQEPESEENASLKDVPLLIRKYLNRMDAFRKNTPVLNEALLRVQKRLAAEGELQGRKDFFMGKQSKVAGKYQTSNEKLARKIMGLEDGVLFADRSVKEEEAVFSNEELVQAFGYLLLELGLTEKEGLKGLKRKLSMKLPH